MTETLLEDVHTRERGEEQRMHEWECAQEKTGRNVANRKRTD